MKEEARIREVIEHIDDLVAACRDLERAWSASLEQVHPEHRRSAHNLLHCVVVNRRRDPAVEAFLRRSGLLGWQAPRLQSHVMASLLTTREALLHMLPGPHPPEERHALYPEAGAERLRRRSDRLFGSRSRTRETRIMVTLPTTAATDAELVARMVGSGMNVARINCAHDGPEAWEAMIGNVRRAAREAGRRVRVVMDLPGPKIRTGPIGQDPHVLKIKPIRDRLGRVVEPGRAFLVPEGTTPPVADRRILPVPPALLDAVEPGDEIRLRDARDKKRRLRVTSVGRTLEVADRTVPAVRVECTHTIYATDWSVLELRRTGQRWPVGDLPPLPGRFWLRPGDHVVLHGRPDEPGRGPVRDEDGAQVEPARVACTWPRVFQDVELGDPVSFDDGSIEGVVREHRGDELVVEVLRALPTGTKLKADKGINFPGSTVSFHGLTAEDREHLPFVATHADALSLSFVHTAADVEELLEALDELRPARELGIILKVETMACVANLVPILLTAMRVKPVGVMIARGDLAVEAGWRWMGFAQEAVLTLCHAGHVPTIWASQVLRTMAKEGVPSRAEITDALMGERAECVMLNKGDYIADAIALLDSLLAAREAVKASSGRIFGLPDAARDGEELPRNLLDPRWRGPGTTLEELLDGED